LTFYSLLQQSAVVTDRTVNSW